MPSSSPLERLVTAGVRASNESRRQVEAIMVRLLESGTDRREETLADLLARGTESSDRMSELVQREVSRQADAFADRIDELEERLAKLADISSLPSDVDPDADASDDPGRSETSNRGTSGGSNSDDARSGKPKPTKSTSGKGKSGKSKSGKTKRTKSGKGKSGKTKSGKTKSGKTKSRSKAHTGKAERSESVATGGSGKPASGDATCGERASGAVAHGHEPVGASGVRRVPTRRGDRVGE